MKILHIISNTVIKILYAFLISFILFYFVLPEYKKYLILFISIWAIVLCCFGSRSNSKFLRSILIFTAGNVFAYNSLKCMDGGPFGGLDSIEWMLSLIALAEMIIAFCLMITPFNRRTRTEASELFSCRQYDLDRIKEFILRVHTLGINSKWGNGKSFIVQKLCDDPDIRKQFEIIQIDLLTCDLNEIENILMLELERILNKHRIFSRNSRLIRNMMGEGQFLKQAQIFFLGSNTTVSSAFLNFKRDVELLSKSILIIYEDIDRITNNETINRIFAISEKLAGEKIRILYQYDQNNLEKQGFSREYLEKYIPYAVNLTDMSYRDIVDNLWDELNMKETEIDKKEIINLPLRVFRNYRLERILNITFEASFVLRGISIRKVQIFLEEIKQMFQQNKELCDKKSRNTVISFFFIKNFYYHNYENIIVGESLDQCFLFHYKSLTYTMNQLYQACKEKKINADDLKEIMEDEQNQEAYLILMLFDYPFDFDEEERSRESIANEAVSSLQKKEKAEKINRLIWNLLGNGRSEFTNMEAAVEKFKTDVLRVPQAHWRGAWSQYQEDAYWDKLWKDNGTIFRFGVDIYLPLFQGLRITNASEEDWLHMLEFYDQMNSEKRITVEFVENLNYCDLKKKRVFLKAIELFCKYNIVGNMNKERCYQSFFKNYFQSVFYLGYSRDIAFEPWRFDFPLGYDHYIDNLEDHMKDMEEALTRDEKRLVLPEALSECSQIRRFIQQNLRLIQEKNPVKPGKMTMHVSEERTVRQNQEEFDRLLALMPEREDSEEKSKAFMDEVEKSYREGKLLPGELRELMNNIIT